MLDSGEMDAVVVGTPMHFHVPQAIMALERNLHVISEVPAGISIEEARQLALDDSKRGPRKRKDAKTVVAAEADVIVTGNIVEETGVSRNLEAIVRTVRENGRQANNRVRPLLE